MELRRTSTRSRVARASIVALLLTGLAVSTAASSWAADPSTERYLGSDRYATAAKASEKTFPSGAATVFIATGASFPDALAGAPASVKAGGALLLTQGNALPAATKTELTRLKPHDIIVLGGTSVISPAVQTELAGYTVGDGGSVHRLSGDDRYGTAAAVVAERFPSADPPVPTPIVYVASGQGYPDALAAGAAAGATGSPLLLVTHDSVPATIAAQLTRLDPASIVVVGGKAAIDDGVEDLLKQAATHATITRVGGTDRYETAVLVASRVFGGSAAAVFIATGLNFPDALAGAAIAPFPPGAGPVLLVPTDCMPLEVDNEIQTLHPAKIVVLGGPAAVSNDAANRVVCSPD